MAASMPVVVAVATSGRAQILAAALEHVAAQSVPAADVVVCTPAGDGASVSSLDLPAGTVHLTAPRGLCSQRNAIMEHLGDRDGVVLFIDDDFILHRDYLRHLASLMEANPDVALINGRLLADGIVGPGLSIGEARRLLDQYPGMGGSTLTIHDDRAAYGCNMAIRLDRARTLRFDENLPLYGWQEDVDFSARLRPFGRIVRTNVVSGVHLGVKLGRTSGVKLGYSQVVNPIYLFRKGTMSAKHVAWLMGKNIGMNLLRSLRPEPYIDRRGRLKGNVLALLDCASARIDPRRVVSLE